MSNGAPGPGRPDGRFTPSITLTCDGRSLTRDQGIVLIGRDEESDLVLPSRRASSRHALIELDDATWTITDLDSLNGTYVDGVLAEAQVPLRNGTCLDLGGDRVEVAISGSSAPSRQTLPVPVDGRIVIGRDPSLDVPLSNPNVSWRHAAITATDGVLQIRDLGSRNGTRLNGRRVDEATITPPAEIVIGPYVLEIGADAQMAPPQVTGGLRAVGLEYDVDDHRVSVDLAVGRGELVAIIGESGAGKSTLLRMLTADTVPLAGRIEIGGEPLERRRWDIGYVAQHDTVHPALTIADSLRCAARLRLPRDLGDEELQRRLDAVTDELRIDIHAHKRNDGISGGQRKRVSVATELLGDPGVFVLDEPTSGLDPLWDQRMMDVLRQRAARGATVLFVTHSTRWLSTCDRLVVMAGDGHIAFDGRPEDALRHFGVTTYEQIYDRLEEQSASSVSVSSGAAPRQSKVGLAPATGMPLRSVVSAGRALVARDMRLVLGDRTNALGRILGAAAVAALVALVFGRDVFVPGPDKVTKGAQLLFAMMFVVMMFAVSSAARDLVRERSVFLRERALGVPVVAYAVSKLVVLGAVATVEATVLCGVTVALAPLHAATLIYLEIFGVVAATAIVGVALGLVLSACARTEAQATTVMSFAFVPQLLLAGAIVSLEHMSAIKWAAQIVPVRWAYAGAGSAVDLYSRHAPGDDGFLRFYGSSFFSVSPLRLVLVFVAFVTGLGVLLVLRLRRESG
ncbi:FHA domain-containing protein [Baekduia sp.]|jgi:ABC-type multidrug transport system ATPase subunit/pSer/pThr/pTyr-binding forkhead associated (FHA) protein/ABC-type multidrug transport system permease subunit|uniref:FHA domain-containing protein n=1 Tax=Baekduia sp. TaxID=2600305 RepID=UPI002E06BCA8|nr:FHA domain-containing protein [Baekduia sp.]